jgi:hypothetical protein
MDFEIFMEVESLEDRDSLIKKIRETEKELVKHPVRTRQEIITEIFESKMHMIDLEPSKDIGYTSSSDTTLVRLLRQIGVQEEIIDAIIVGLENEPEETKMEIILSAMDTPRDLQSWPFFLKMNRKNWLQWLARMLERAKLSIESINSIIFGLELNLEPAKGAATRILFRLRFPREAIEWLISKMITPDNE